MGIFLHKFTFNAAEVDTADELSLDSGVVEHCSAFEVVVVLLSHRECNIRGIDVHSPHLFVDFQPIFSTTGLHVAQKNGVLKGSGINIAMDDAQNHSLLFT